MHVAKCPQVADCALLHDALYSKDGLHDRRHGKEHFHSPSPWVKWVNSPQDRYFPAVATPTPSGAGLVATTLLGRVWKEISAVRTRVIKQTLMNDTGQRHLLHK